MPIVPTVLINGAEGIGTGWSTYVGPLACFDHVRIHTFSILTGAVMLE